MPDNVGSNIARGNRVQGKVALVTGAAQGIGRACAVALAAQGARVAICDVQQSAGEAAAESIRRSGGEAVYIFADVGKEEACKAAIEQTVAAFGGLDVLVNNAAISPRASLIETSAEIWDEVMAINLRAPFLCCKYAIPHLARSRGASIINIGSIHGVQSLPNLVAYGAAKGGLLTLTRSIAGAYARDKIRANYIIPGWVLTEGDLVAQRRSGFSDLDLEEMGKGLPLGRHQSCDDVAYAVIYLASDESAQMTGSIMHVDAGVSNLPLVEKGDYPDAAAPR
jgi:NAD(P)-dependent dehydrogenase (short-subunit alcohol dehydrogenase family)